MADSDLAINYLRYWWNATPIANLGFSTFQDALAHYKQVRPAFLSELGRAVKSIRQDKVKRAFEALAKKSADTYPAPAEFYDALAGEQKSLDLGDVKEIAAETAHDVGNAVKIGASIYLIGAALVGLVFLLPMLKGRARA